MNKVKIAIISDLHGNLPAFEAVLEDINKRGCHQTICLGDIIGKGPESSQVLDLCLKTCDILVKGNWDDFISDPKTELTDFIQYYRDELGEDRLEVLRHLPEVTEFWLSGRYVRLFHANPHSLYDRVHGTSSLEERLSLFEIPKLLSTSPSKIKSDIVGYGDIHGGYLQHLSESRVLFNVGSVGNSCDSIPMASYVILEGYLNESLEEDFSIQFFRVKYNRNLSIERAICSQMPGKDAYINELKTGLYSR